PDPAGRGSAGPARLCGARRATETAALKRLRRRLVAVAADLVADHAAHHAAHRRPTDVTGDARADRRSHPCPDYRIAIALAHAGTRRQARGKDAADQQLARPF